MLRTPSSSNAVRCDLYKYHVVVAERMMFFFSRAESPMKQQVERNRLWSARLRVVKIMELWLKDHVTVDVGNDEVSEILHVHFMVGKVLYPTDNRDALFTFVPYENEHMSGRLRKPGMYALFRDELTRLHKQMVIDAPPVPPTWAEAFPLVESSAGKLQLKRLKTELEKGGYDTKIVEQVMIGLILRYACVGGWDGAMHSSVPKSWSSAFEGSVDCFASPMNHRFPVYYSMFEEDILYFHSKGNFFLDRGSILPIGRYHMHPPDIPCFYKEIHRILCTSLPSVTMKIILVVPAFVSMGSMGKKFDKLVVDQIDAAFKLEIPRMPLVHANGFCLTSPIMAYIMGVFPSRSKLVGFFYQQD